SVPLQIPILAEQPRPALRRQHQPKMTLVLISPVAQPLARMLQLVVGAIVELAILPLPRFSMAFEVGRVRQQPTAAAPATPTATASMFPETHLHHRTLARIARQRTRD